MVSLPCLGSFATFLFVYFILIQVSIDVASTLSHLRTVLNNLAIKHFCTPQKQPAHSDLFQVPHYQQYGLQQLLPRRLAYPTKKHRCNNKHESTVTFQGRFIQKKKASVSGSKRSWPMRACYSFAIHWHGLSKKYVSMKMMCGVIMVLVLTHLIPTKLHRPRSSFSSPFFPCRRLKSDQLLYISSFKQKRSTLLTLLPLLLLVILKLGPRSLCWQLPPLRLPISAIWWPPPRPSDARSTQTWSLPSIFDTIM